MEALRINQRAVVHELVDGEVVAVNLETGTYYSMQGTAAACWSALTRPVLERELVAWLAHRFSVPPAAAAADLERFVADLIGEGLVVRDPAAHAGDVAVDAALPSAGSSYEPPGFRKFEDMQELLLLDPIHDVDEAGWPIGPPDRSAL